MPEKNVKVALVQHPPVFLNLQKTLAKVETIAEESAKSGAKIIVFPEKKLLLDTTDIIRVLMFLSCASMTSRIKMSYLHRKNKKSLQNRQEKQDKNLCVLNLLCG